VNTYYGKYPVNT